MLRMSIIKKIGLGIALTTLLSTVCFANEPIEAKFIIDQNQYTIGDVEKNMDTAPYIKDGRTMLPIRYISDVLGISEEDVKWDHYTKKVTIIKENDHIEMKIGSKDLYKSGQKIEMDAVAEIKDGRTMLPLRAIAEAMDIKIGWDRIKRMVTIEVDEQKLLEEDTELKVENLANNDIEKINIVKGTEEDNKNELVYTSEQVVEKALKNSADIKEKEKDLERASEVYEDTELVLGTYIPSLIQGKKGLEINEEWAEKNLEITKESVEDLVINSINEINILKEKIDVNDIKIQNSKEELEMMKLKKDLGLESQYNYDNFKKEHEDLIKEHEKLKIDMKNSYIVLEEKFGLENLEQYDLQNEITYKPLVDLDIDTRVRQELASNLQIWYTEKNVELKELAVKLYEYNKKGDSYTVKNIDVTKAKITLDQAKTNLEYSMRLLYNGIKKIEEQHEQLQLKLQKTQNTLNTAKANYAAGLIIELDVKKLEAGIKELEAGIKELEMNHEKQVKYLNKPYLQQK